MEYLWKYKAGRSSYYINRALYTILTGEALPVSTPSADQSS